jgi:capsular exopolysaccharide synthesis family protein
MSKFVKALEQAEREHALRQKARRGEDAAGSGEPPIRPVSPPEGRVPGAPRLHDVPRVPDVPERREEGAVPTAVRVETAPAAVEVPTWPVRRRPAVPATTTTVLPAETVDGIEEHLVSLLAPASMEAEQYRALRYLVERMHRTHELTIIGVSSAAVGDGKTTTAINLAGALAQAPDSRVLLVDADLRQPAVVRYLGIAEGTGPGLVDAILRPDLNLETVTVDCAPFNLSVVPSGRLMSVSYEVLKSARLGDLLEAARARYDYVVVDTPPLVPFPDCQLIGQLVDGFLVVVDAHRTPRKLVAEALQVMDPSRIIGFVFNGDDRKMTSYYGSRYARTQVAERPRERRGLARALGGRLARLKLRGSSGS